METAVKRERETTKNFKIEGYTIGSDAELFLFDKEKNEVINAKKYIKGTKQEPFNFDKSSPFWCTSLDNISTEFNIPPCTTAKEFSEGLEKCIKYINSNLPENICTIHTPAVYVNPKHLRTKEARTLGCESSYSAYTMRRNPPPDGFVTNLRTCCTHIHMKYERMRFENACEWVKAMDLFLGIPSLLIEPYNERRRLYGTLGEMRFGETVEYRTMSSYFSETARLREWVFNNTVNAINWINEGKRITDRLAEDFHHAMNENDTDLARVIVEEYKVPMPSI